MADDNFMIIWGTRVPFGTLQENSTVKPPSDTTTAITAQSNEQDVSLLSS